jgi:hypothetical protein
LQNNGEKVSLWHNVGVGRSGALEQRVLLLGALHKVIVVRSIQARGESSKWFTARRALNRIETALKKNCVNANYTTSAQHICVQRNCALLDLVCVLETRLGIRVALFAQHVARIDLRTVLAQQRGAGVELRRARSLARNIVCQTHSFFLFCFFYGF